MLFPPVILINESKRSISTLVLKITSPAEIPMEDSFKITSTLALKIALPVAISI